MFHYLIITLSLITLGASLLWKPFPRVLFWFLCVLIGWCLILTYSRGMWNTFIRWFHCLGKRKNIIFRERETWAYSLCEIRNLPFDFSFPSVILVGWGRHISGFFLNIGKTSTMLRSERYLPIFFFLAIKASIVCFPLSGFPFDSLFLTLLHRT